MQHMTEDRAGGRDNARHCQGVTLRERVIYGAGTTGFRSASAPNRVTADSVVVVVVAVGRTLD